MASERAPYNFSDVKIVLPYMYSGALRLPNHQTEIWCTAPEWAAKMFNWGQYLARAGPSKIRLFFLKVNPILLRFIKSVESGLNHINWIRGINQESEVSTRNQRKQPGINGIKRKNENGIRPESARNQWNQPGINGIKWNQRNQVESSEKNTLIPGINGISYAFYGVIRPSILPSKELMLSSWVSERALRLTR